MPVKASEKQGPKSAIAEVHDDFDYMKASYFLEDLDVEADLKAADKDLSPKSAHHAMGLEAHEYQASDEEDPNSHSPKKEEYGKTEEEQRKGLWRSIFGYFRGPRHNKPNKAAAEEKESKSVKDIKEQT